MEGTIAISEDCCRTQCDTVCESNWEMANHELVSVFLHFSSAYLGKGLMSE